MSKVHSSLGVNVLRPVNLGWQYQIPTDSLRDDEVIHVDSPNTDLVLIICDTHVKQLETVRIKDRNWEGKFHFEIEIIY